MFCTNCGSKNEDGSGFCIKCGHLLASNQKEVTIHPQQSNLNERWWHRLLKVVYIVSYLPLLLIIPMVWSENAQYCYTLYTNSIPSCHGSAGESFWYSLLTLAIYVAILRLIKLAVLYIVKGSKPVWRKEFKKLF